MSFAVDGYGPVCGGWKAYPGGDVKVVHSGAVRDRWSVMERCFACGVS